MKKILSLVLAVMLLLGLCACGQGEKTAETMAAETAVFSVGYSRTNITPNYSVPLGGYGNSSFRMSDGFLDYLYTTALAISDGENTIVLIENDMHAAVQALLDNVRKEVSAETGIPVEQIMVGVSHAHSTPDLWNAAESSIGQYTTEVKKNMVKNAVAAVKDMKPATVSGGSGETPEHTSFVRHYQLEDGHVRGPNFGLQYTSPMVGHTHEPDRQMQVLKFERDGEKPIVLVNWQSHPQMATEGGKSLSITADTVGVMRDRVMDSADCEFIYMLGASGDILGVSQIDSENVVKDYKEMGNTLGDTVLEILQDMEPVKTGTVGAAFTSFEATVDHTEDGKAAGASVVKEYWEKTNDFNGSVAMGEPYGINSPYHATAIITKGGLDKTGNVDLYAFVVGDLAFVCAPYEMFCENGAYIKENSPVKNTVVMTMTNGSHSYISSAAGYDYNCYEANTCRYVKGTGEALAEEFVMMLYSLHGNE